MNKRSFELDDQESSAISHGLPMGAFLIAMVTFIMLFMSHQPLTLFYVLPVAIAITGWKLAPALAKRTQQGAREVHRWEAFRNFLTDFSNLENASEKMLPMWDKYLVYATALGVATEFSAQLKKPRCKCRMRIGAWAAVSIHGRRRCYMMHSGSVGGFQLSDMTSSLSTSMRDAATDYASMTRDFRNTTSGSGLEFRRWRERIRRRLQRWGRRRRWWRRQRRELMLWIILILLALVGGIIFLYNRLVTLRRRCQTQWLQIDVMLKRRHDLIPELVTVVKAHQEFEKGTLENVTRMRTAVDNASSQNERVQAESMLGAALGSMLIVAEQYPALKAEKLTGQLLDGLIETEEQIRYDRQFYNDTVVKYNTALESFPDMFVAKAFGFRRYVFFNES
ncbi:MAG: LemA family protein [bacterium]|nr:LemA family protein [bacterium]